MRGTISNVLVRLERQTTTFKDRFSLFSMIFKINIIKISVYRRHTYMGDLWQNNDYRWPYLHIA